MADKNSEYISFGDKRNTIIKINFPWSLREMFLDASELSLA